MDFRKFGNRRHEAPVVAERLSFELRSTAPRCIILGGGGHTQSIINSLDTQIGYMVILDDDPTLWNNSVCGIEVWPCSISEGLKTAVERGAKEFVVGLGGVGNNDPRKSLFEQAKAAGLIPLSVVLDPSAILSRWADVQGGTVLLANSVVGPGARIGENVIVNTGAIVEHDCWVGDHVHIATGAKLGGSVVVREGAHVGIGASIKQGVEIGEWSIVAAGAAVISNISPKTVVGGVPAQVIRSF